MARIPHLLPWLFKQICPWVAKIDSTLPYLFPLAYASTVVTTGSFAPSFVAHIWKTICTRQDMYYFAVAYTVCPSAMALRVCYMLCSLQGGNNRMYIPSIYVIIIDLYTSAFSTMRNIYISKLASPGNNDAVTKCC